MHTDFRDNICMFQTIIQIWGTSLLLDALDLKENLPQETTHVLDSLLSI